MREEQGFVLGCLMGLVTSKKVRGGSEIGCCWDKFSDTVRCGLWGFAVEKRGFCRMRRERKRERGKAAMRDWKMQRDATESLKRVVSILMK